MNFKKVAFVLLITTSTMYPNGVLVPVHPVHEEATQQLWEGILNSDVRQVERALEQDADTTMLGGRYRETPLMTALRIYCGGLKTNKTKQKNAIAKYSIAILGSLSVGLVTLSLLNFLQKKLQRNDATAAPDANAGDKPRFSLLFIEAALNKTNIATVLAMGATFLGIMQLPITLVPASAKIVELLIEHDSDLQARNAEGNNALDILLAYFPYAYKYQDKYWYRFLRLLQKGPNQ